MTHGNAPFDSTNSLVPAPIDQSLIDMLENSPLGPILETPVGDVLSKLGLPPLPQMPAPLPPAMPGLPPFPPIDIEHLFKPLTDLAQSFGSGDLGESGFDPTQLFTGLSSIMQSMIGMSGGALKAADQVWQGQAAMSNAAKSATAAGQAGAVAGKSSGIAANTQAGAGIVGTGNASIQGVIAKFNVEVTMTLPLLMTPPTAPAGMMAILAAASAALGEAIAIVTGTKTALAPETATQTANGAQIPITGAPTSPSPFGIAASVLESVGQPISGLAGTGTSMMGSMTKQLTAAHQASLEKAKGEKGATVPAGLHSGAGGAGKKGGGAGGGGAGGGGVGAPATQLQARPGAPNLGTGPVEGTTGGATSAPAARGVGGATTGSGMMPMGAGAAGAAGAARGAGADDGHGSPDFLVTADHGTEVVGDMPHAAPPVLGGDSEIEVESPDVDLRL
ncbi:hypothetical protein GTV32_15205 [Gordonia sp. SID5947]|uniref:hypothetical protein n=1 Tax=Gordonia sp. SID5947 TaxID=2690315 RepID=UPI00136EACC6|nr:hypothetical protein [Gordonia sp. SID5947]MYR07568.1 hypothetical protein [Gordonia sp. SID5947]